MKYSIIKEIYYGNRGQGENINTSEEFRKLNDEALSIYYNLLKSLNDEQKELLEKLLNKELEMESETILNNYKEGLKIGLLLFAECMQD